MDDDEAIAEVLGGDVDAFEVLVKRYERPVFAIAHSHGAGGEAIPGYRPGIFSTDPADPDYSTTGIFGDPTLATAEKGRRAVEIMTREWLRALRLFARVPAPD